jgi:uncharacterized delta-60 repeat protein
MLLASLFRSFARSVCSVSALAGVVALGLASAFAQTPSAVDGFDPDVDGNVLAIATQPDGKLLIGGQFTAIRGTARANLARLNPDGSVDASFNPTTNGIVRAIMLQPDNRIVIGGDFTSLQPGTGTAVTRNRVARLNADGSVDAAFNPNVSADIFRAQVFALALQPNGQIVIGGTFTAVQPPTAAAPIARNNLARFNADGTLDASYNPNPNSTVLALALHVDGKLLVGGGFTVFQPAGDASPTTRNRIARLNPSGTVDSEFDPNANNGVSAIVVQRDGKILLGGFFTSLQPLGESAAVLRSHIARLNPSGTIDSEFYPRVEGNVASLALQTDGSILVGGTFTTAWGRGTSGATRNFIARFGPDGSLDADFSPTLNSAPDAIAPQADGKIVVGGHFTRAQTEGGSTTLIRNHLARLNADGSIDASFELNAGGRILVSVTQADGKVVIGGSFTNVGGSTHNYLARLNADGTVDNTYNPDLNGRVYTLVIQPDGKVIAGGAFTTIGGETRNHIARFNPSGTIDSEFNPNIDGQVGVIVLQSDQRILVGGTFNNVQPIGAASTTARSSLLRLNANGTLDTTFDPTPNSSVASIAVQPDGKIVIGGLFSALTPGFSTSISAATTARNFLARLNADGTVDTAFNPNPNGLVSTIAVQADGKVVVGGGFTLFLPPNATETVTRNRIARINADGTLDTTYNPNADGNVLTSALQPDGKLLIGGSFLLLRPNAETVPTLRKYAARLNTDGSVDPTFNLDIGEQSGNRVDSLRIQPDGRVLIGGNFTSLQPTGTPARLTRRNFARLTATGIVDSTFDPGAAGSTGAIVNGFAMQPDGKVIAVGSFADLGGARTTNIARFLPEGAPDPTFGSSLTTDGPINAVAIRPNGAPVASQVAGFAWLNANGTLRTAFAPNARLSGEVNAIAVQPDGRVLMGGTFSNLSNTTAGNLVRFNATGAIDVSFNPDPNGAVTTIALQSDGKILIGGSFTVVSGVSRNRIARLNADGTLDTTFDPNASARVNAIVVQGDGFIVIGGAFTALTPNGTTTAVSRNYLARLNANGTVDENYLPTPNFNVNALTIQEDGKVIAGGAFTSLTPNGALTSTTRNGLARVNLDGSLDQNFNPNVNGAITSLVAVGGGQILVGGGFTTLQPGATGTVFTRNNIARINSDGAVDTSFDPNANGAVTTLAVQPDGSILVGGAFTTLQPAGVASGISRNSLARLTAAGALDLNFNPDVNGGVSAVVARPDGSVLVGGTFTNLQLNGSIYVGGSFASIGGIPAGNLAAVNEGGSVNTSFQPRPDAAVNALLVQPDGKVVVGGAFSNIAGVSRSRLARFNADGTLDTAFNPGLSAGTSSVLALARQSDGRILVGGQFTTIGGQARTNIARLNVDGTVDTSFTGSAAIVQGLAVTASGRILALIDAGTSGRSLIRLNADGSADTSFATATGAGGSIVSFAAQADGSVVVVGGFTSINGVARTRIARLTSTGAVDSSYVTDANGNVTAVALQADGRALIGGSFTTAAGQPRVGLARLSATSIGTQTLGVTANRASVIWSRSGAAPEISGVIFEQSNDRITWTRLGEGTRVGSTADWQLAGLNLPSSGLFYVRARGIVPTSGGKSSGIFETIREFNFANPLAPAAGSIAQTTPPQAASSIAFDPITGIAARSTIIMVPGEGSVEIYATAAQRQVGSGPSRLANLSTRGRVTAENPLILGFAIAGTEPRRVLLRAVGPGLAGFGVTDALAATRLQVYTASGAQLVANEGWGNAAALVQAAATTGAFPLTAGSADSAALLTLNPGNYTIQVVDTRSSGGIALAEIYDADNGPGSRLVNVSSRGAAGAGSAALISGFVIAGGDASERVLLRAIGPGLAKFGATGVVADPAIALYDAQGLPLGTNDNWVSSVSTISTAALASGAFALDAGSKDAAVLATLPSGAYTIQVTGGSTGTALLEIYEAR